MMDITAGKTRQFYASVEAYIQSDRQTKLERMIVSTVQEAPGRVVIVANIRNVTAIPAGIKPPSPMHAEWREKGEDYKYVLVLDGAQWKVLEVWTLKIAPRMQFEQIGPEYPAFVPPQ